MVSRQGGRLAGQGNPRGARVRRNPMWSRGHVLGGRVTAATRLWFPDFAMRWGFGRPGVRGDRRDLSTGMSGGAGVGLPRLGVSGNGNTGWGRHICWLYPLCDVESRLHQLATGLDRPRQGQAWPSMAASGRWGVAQSGMRLGRFRCRNVRHCAVAQAAPPAVPASRPNPLSAPGVPRRARVAITGQPATACMAGFRTGRVLRGMATTAGKAPEPPPRVKDAVTPRVRAWDGRDVALSA